MTETNEGESRTPIFVHGRTRPKDGKDYTWAPKYRVDKPSEIEGWTRIGKSPALDEEGFYPPDATKKRDDVKKEKNTAFVEPTQAAKSAQAMQESQDRTEANLRKVMGLPPEDEVL
jgi:hypothetical protein